MRFPQLLVLVALALVLPLAAVADPLIPAKRLQVWDNTDLPKGDLSSIFDTTIDACERACLNTDKCQAVVFNTKANSCFLKAGKLTPQPFDGAYSAFVIKADPAAEGVAKARREALAFLGDGDMESATAVAADLTNQFTTNGYSADEHLGSAHDREKSGDYTSAYRFAGAATVVSDASADWLEYARLLLAAADHDSNNASTLRQSAVEASVNA